MADDSIEIRDDFNFHPCDSPRGMLYYDLSILTANQQIQLNEFKRNTIREDEKYLAGHPEIRALAALATRHVLLQRPRTDLHDCVAQFFRRPKPDLHDEVHRYLETREVQVYEDIIVARKPESSAVTSAALPGSPVPEKEEEEEQEENLDNLPRQMLDEILDKALKRLGIDVYDKDDWQMQDGDVGDETPRSVVQSVISEVLKAVVPDEQADIVNDSFLSAVANAKEEASTNVAQYSDFEEASFSEQVAFDTSEIRTEMNLEPLSKEPEEQKQTPEDVKFKENIPDEEQVSEALDVKTEHVHF